MKYKEGVYMLHKISDFCDKIDALKKDADRLRKLKYGEHKASIHEIDNLIEQIQSDCLLLSKDRSPYQKTKE